jgi:polysaccharide deacetylase family protein (PEP-CTERM system associated)
MNILTFDIEDWFHILDNAETKGIEQWSQFESRLERNLDIIFQILKTHGQNATFFVVGWMAEQYPIQIRRIIENGYEVGSHTHLHQLVYEQSSNEFNRDLEKSIHTLEQCTGMKVQYFRAPGFSITGSTPWAFDVLIKNGITIDSSVFPALRAHGGFEKFGSANPSIIEHNGLIIKEFPINTHSILGKDIIFSGGGYFRLLPYGLIKSFTKKSDYIMTYFHPRDFDPDQPMAPGLSLSRKFKSYYGLSKTEQKLKRWLTEFDFIDLKEANEKVNWNEIKSIRLS